MKGNRPANWKKVKIGDVLTLEYGKSLPAKDRSGEGFPVMGSNGEVGRHDQYLVEGPGIVVGRKGSHGEVRWVDESFYPIDTTYYVIPKDCINFKFIYNYLKYTNLKSLNRSTAIPGLNRNDVYGLEIPLPPLAEQKRIVAKLDEVFKHLETLKAKLDRIPELLEKFRQTVLAHAVTGKLTEEWRKGKKLEVFEIFEKLKSSYRDGKRECFFEAVSNEPFPIPDSWRFCYLGALCEKVTYGTSVKSVDTGRFAVLRMGNLQNGKIDWTDLKYTSDLDEFKKYSLKRGDVLFNRTNSPELVGKTSIYDGEMDAIYAGYLMKILNIPELNSHYLNYLLNSPYARDWCLSVKTDGVNQSNINAQKLQSFIVPYPSYEEQGEIVRQIDG